MQAVKFFVDTHDTSSKTFPAWFTNEQCAEFYPRYEQACRGEGVINLCIRSLKQILVGFTPVRPRDRGVPSSATP